MAPKEVALLEENPGAEGCGRQDYIAHCSIQKSNRGKLSLLSLIMIFNSKLTSNFKNKIKKNQKKIYLGCICTYKLLKNCVFLSLK